MRQSRLSGSVEGVMGNHDSYSDTDFACCLCPGRLATIRKLCDFETDRASPGSRRDPESRVQSPADLSAVRSFSDLSEHAAAEIPGQVCGLVGGPISVGFAVATLVRIAACGSAFRQP